LRVDFAHLREDLVRIDHRLDTFNKRLERIPGRAGRPQGGGRRTGRGPAPGRLRPGRCSQARAARVAALPPTASWRPRPTGGCSSPTGRGCRSSSRVPASRPRKRS